MFSKVVGIFLIAFIPSAVFASGVHKFGCPFLDDSYDLSEATIVAPIFGTSLEPLAIADKECFQKLYNKIEEISSKFVGENVFNSLDDYIEFYNDFANTTEEFEDFYKSYQPKFNPLQNSVGFSTALLDKLSSELSADYPKFAESIFLSGAQYKIKLSDEELASINDAYLTTEKGKKLNYIFPILKFSLSSRTGFIIFDPTNGVVKPYVVMEDKESPVEGASYPTTDERTKVKFEIHDSNKNFITGKVASGEESKPVLEILAYVGQPHCSVMDITQKFNLIKQDRYLVKKFSNGKAEAGIYFDALPVETLRQQKKSYYYIVAFLRQNPTDKDARSLKISLTKFASTTETLTVEEYAMLEEISPKLGLTSEALRAKLTAVTKVLNDNKFMVESFIELTKLYGFQLTGELVNEEDQVVEGLKQLGYLCDH